ncbi:unnamed protein product [Rhodiola kirilowii]
MKNRNSVRFEVGSVSIGSISVRFRFGFGFRYKNPALLSTLLCSPAVTKSEAPRNLSDHHIRPKSILKKKQKTRVEPKLRVSINLRVRENKISLLRNTQLLGGENEERIRSTRDVDEKLRNEKSVSEVLRELNVDIFALQDVKADEENEMKPLSDLAEALGMNYVFAETWAPQYGNAILSRWPIKRFNVQKLLDDFDFRNVLKATIDVPGAGEVNFYCTQLDHLNEDRRMNQINAIIESNGEPHLLAGGLNLFLGHIRYTHHKGPRIITLSKLI